jgi:hypothetical protein
MNGNEYSAALATKFLYRMYDTQDLSSMLLTYIFTEEGRGWYLRLPDRGLDSKEQVWKQITPAFNFFIDLLGLDKDLLHATLHEYFDGTPRWAYTGINEPTLKFWARIHAAISPTGSYRDPKSLTPLATLARILCQLPLSEVEAERVFSHMKRLFGDRSRSTGDDLIEARLTIKLENLMSAREIGEGCKQSVPLPAAVMAQLQTYLVGLENQPRWGTHQMSKKNARQYPRK